MNLRRASLKAFGPNRMTTVNTETDFNVDLQTQDWWQDIIMLKVLTQYQEATEDKRVIPFMSKYFSYLKTAIIRFPLKEWAQARGTDLLLSIHWLHEKLEDPALLDLANIVREQTINWTSILSNFQYKRKQTEWDHRIHVVNVAMATKTPAVFYRQTEHEIDRNAIYKGIESLMTDHGQANPEMNGSLAHMQARAPSFVQWSNTCSAWKMSFVFSGMECLEISLRRLGLGVPIFNSDFIKTTLYGLHSDMTKYKSFPSFVHG